MRFRLSSIPFPLLLTLAAVTGAINVFSFAPYRLWPLQLATLALLIFCLRQLDGKDSVRRGALFGWAYGFGWIAHGVYWIYISLHDFGGLPGWLAVLAVAVLAAIIGLYTALCAGLSLWLQRRWNASPLLFALAIFPAMWGLTEWLRGWLFTGFPWLISGYAHTAGPLSGFAPLVGVYGVGCISAVIAGCLALLPQSKLPAAAALLALLAGLVLHQINWTTPHGKPISVRLSAVRSSSVIVDVRAPPIITSPLFGRSSKPARCNSVDLPAPEGAISATDCPGLSAKLAPANTSTVVSPRP